ncbi:fimbrial protein [Burkholderiaceae bacterium DAT-1]|nr:fimbrial protein [Burkholderiaceae bacterium DAT-1]
MANCLRLIWMGWILLGCLIVSVRADCYSSPSNTYPSVDTAITEYMTISIPTLNYSALSKVSGMTLAFGSSSTATSNDGNLTTFVCVVDTLVNTTTNVNASFSGSSGSISGYYKLANKLYLRVTFQALNKAYPFSQDMSSLTTLTNPASLGHLAEVVYIEDGTTTANPSYAGGQVVARFQEPACASNPRGNYSKVVNGRTQYYNCLNMQLTINIGAISTATTCNANLPSTILIPTQLASVITNTTKQVATFTATLNCSGFSSATILFNGPAGSVGTNLANQGTASPLSIGLALASSGGMISTGVPVSLPITSSTSNSWLFNVYTISSSASLQPGTINVPVNWTITYQ